MNKDILDSRKIIETIQTLCFRIEDRFPDSSLLQVAKTLLETARETDRTIRWIARPNLAFRLLSVIVIALAVMGLAYTLSLLRYDIDGVGVSDVITLSEAAINELILLGAAVLFIVTYETRRKRKRIVSALNRLRSIAHVIDAHQLTKDPGTSTKPGRATAHSPKRGLDNYQLSRYLDYCSELLALTGKVAFLYVQKFQDPVSLNAVNDLESLTTGLSRKIWQKIMLIKTDENA